MAIDFPNSPTDGELFTAGSTKWIYNAAAGKWNIAAPETPSTTAFAPIGTVINYMGSSPPNGWILCNGASLSRSTYANLFAVLGTTFGQGSNPGSTFAIPNFIGTTGIYIIRATDDVVTVSSASNLLAMPVGTMSLFAMTTVPNGWVRCNGQALSRTGYADLFSAISTTYGTGDGSTTFNVPDIPGSGTGSPLHYIKAILSGDAPPATVAHASSHIRTGTDIIDGDQLQVDYVPAWYTRNGAASGAGATTDLAAHLSGIDAAVGTGRIVQALQAQSTQITVNTTAWTTIVSQAITTTKANSRILVLFTGDANANDAGAWKRIGIFIDGTLQYYTLTSTNNVGFQEVTSMSGVFTIASAGAHTVAIQAQSGAGSTTFSEEGGNHKNNLVVLEIW